MDAAATCLHNVCQRRQEHLSEVEQRQELIESQFLKVCPSIAAEMSVWARTPGSTCARSAQKASLEYTEVGADGECDARPRSFHRLDYGI